MQRADDLLRAEPGTDFKLVRTRGQEAVFENSEHAFPQRIIYRRNQDGSLTARIEGDRGGRIARMDLYLQPSSLLTKKLIHLRHCVPHM